MALVDTSYDLASACSSAADAISSQRRADGYTETSGEAATLDHLVSSLRDAADSLRTAGVAASLESAASPLADIDSAAKQATAAVKKLKDANQMITIAGSLISLAAAAASGNLGGIASSASAVISEVGGL